MGPVSNRRRDLRKVFGFGPDGSAHWQTGLEMAITLHRGVAGYAVATLGTVALTLGLLAFRDQITPLSKGFGFLVVVVAAAGIGGLGPGILASLLGFLTFNFFFLPPYHTFVIARVEDIVVLFVFLGLSILISALLAHARERAEAAEARAHERDQALRSATEAEVYRQTDQLRRALLAAVSHDLRSPLAAIKASVTDLLGDDAEQDADYARETLESIDKETDRLAALIANLLDMSRIEGGMLEARLQSVDLAEVVTACVDRVRRQWPRLTVRVGIAPSAATVRADPVFLDRVVANLLDNAAKAAARSGTDEIRLQASRADGRALIRVTDHGHGVPPLVREQLFYPFYQVSERHPRLGTGLGLAISKGFLTLMDGQIWVEDTPGPGGATFAFSLPAGGRP
jgi:two-component system sensor histidine kinase KdpD